MASTQRQQHWYATKDDMLPVLMHAESLRPLQYTRRGLFERAEEAVTYHSAMHIPGLGTSATADITDPNWVITDCGTPTVPGVVPQSRGGVRYELNGTILRCGIELRPPGVYKKEAVIEGLLRMVDVNPTTNDLFDLFAKEAKKRFTKHEHAWVGPEAAKLFHAGYLLTQAIGRPKGQELKLKK